MPTNQRIPERLQWTVELLDAQPAEHLLEEHGFTVADVQVKSFRTSHGLCIVGRSR